AVGFKAVAGMHLLDDERFLRVVVFVFGLGCGRRSSGGLVAAAGGLRRGAWRLRRGFVGRRWGRLLSVGGDQCTGKQKNQKTITHKFENGPSHYPMLRDARERGPGCDLSWRS